MNACDVLGACGWEIHYRVIAICPPRYHYMWSYFVEAESIINVGSVEAFVNKVYGKNLVEPSVQGSTIIVNDQGDQPPLPDYLNPAMDPEPDRRARLLVFRPEAFTNRFIPLSRELPLSQTCKGSNHWHKKCPYGDDNQLYGVLHQS